MIRTNKKISPFGKGTARWMFYICLCRNYLLWTFSATILWKTQPWDIFAWLPTAKCIASSNHDVSLEDDYSVPFFDLNFFYPHITSHVLFAKSFKHLRRKGLRKLEKYIFCGLKKESFISDGRKIQVNSSKKYVKFFSSGYYFPSYISPLSNTKCHTKI